MLSGSIGEGFNLLIEKKRKRGEKNGNTQKHGRQEDSISTIILYRWGQSSEGIHNSIQYFISPFTRNFTYVNKNMFYNKYELK